MVRNLKIKTKIASQDKIKMEYNYKKWTNKKPNPKTFIK